MDKKTVCLFGEKFPHCAMTVNVGWKGLKVADNKCHKVGTVTTDNSKTSKICLTYISKTTSNSRIRNVHYTDS